MRLQPWHKVAAPREDLREGKPVDAAEFAVHLDQVRDGRAQADYQEPGRFFDKTYLTQNLLGLAAEVVRRLSGIHTGTSAVFNMTTQFGGGKTHALTLLYHLAKAGGAAKGWTGVDRILAKAQVTEPPEARIGVFVGTEFDSLSGRGGTDGAPLRRTPWGELAWQLGGAEGFEKAAEHDRQGVAPSTEVIRSFIPTDRPCLILMDELMNYINRSRRDGMASQLHSFVQNLSEEARAQDRMALVVSVPASEMEMTAEDHADYERLKKLLDRLGKAVIMSAENEAAEIIRRRLFEWGPLSRDAEKVIGAYADWTVEHRSQLPGWFAVDDARAAFRASYPFHPSVLSVFERKWQQLPRFQQTRGVLRMLALWVSRAYQEGYQKAHGDALIGLGTAPLDDSIFRAAVFEQLGDSRLEGAVTTDIDGRSGSHAKRLDNEATPEIKKARLHRKAATSIFFESNGGQLRANASVPEVRLAVGEPGLDIGHIETVLETLSQTCYYLSVSGSQYRFSATENLIKRYNDRRASVAEQAIGERVRLEVKKVFSEGEGIECVFYPEKSGDIPDRPVLTLAVLDPETSMADSARTLEFVRTVTREAGRSGRTYKSAIVWVAADSPHALRDEARKMLAWEAINGERGELHVDGAQLRQLDEQVGRARRDLKEAVWRTYKHLLLLGKDGEMRQEDLGLLHSSQARTLVDVLIQRLREKDDIARAVTPTFLVRNWPPAVAAWSTRAVRDAFFASPAFPRLQDAEAVRESIARGVSEGVIAYGVKQADGGIDPLVFEQEMSAIEVEISEEACVLRAEDARKLIEPPRLTALEIRPRSPQIQRKGRTEFDVRALDQHGRSMAPPALTWETEGDAAVDGGVFVAGEEPGDYVVKVRNDGLSATATVSVVHDDAPPPPPPAVDAFTRVSWSGEVPPQKWMNFYMNVLAKHVTGGRLRLHVTFEVEAEGGIPPHAIEETRSALRELGLADDVRTSE